MTCEILVSDDAGRPDYHCREEVIALLFDKHGDSFKVCREHLYHYSPEINAGLMQMEPI